MKENRLDNIKNKFFDIYSAICDFTDNEIMHGPVELFRSHFERLNMIAAIDVDDCAVQIMIRDRKFRPVIKHIAHLKRGFGLRMEIDAARSIIKSVDSWSLIKNFMFYPNYVELAHMEKKGANFDNKDRIAFIGSGPLPLSLIFLCKLYGVECIGMEQLSEYAEISRKVIQALGLTNHISIISGNHFSLPLNQKIKLVMVGADASPKDEIFDRLAKALPDGTKVSYRIYEKGLRRILDDQSSFNIPPELTEYTRIRPKPPVNNTSVFLIKNII